MPYAIAAAVVLVFLRGFSAPRGLSEDERRKLEKGDVFAQAPGTRGPHDPMAPWFDRGLVMQEAGAIALLGAERVKEVRARGWIFWGKP